MEKMNETEVKTVAEGRALLERYRTKMRQEARTFSDKVKIMHDLKLATHLKQTKQK